MKDTEEIIKAKLSPNEKLVWFGQPRKGLIFRAGDIFLIPFSILWGGFAIFWETGVLASKAPGPFALFGIPFVAIGLYMILGRFIFDMKTRESTIYALSSERVLIITGANGGKTKSINLGGISDISLSEGSNDLGTITFGPTHPMDFWNRGFNVPWAGRDFSPCFEQIKEAKMVYDKIMEVQRNNRRAL